MKLKGFKKVKEIITASEKGTVAQGKILGKKLKPGDIVGFSGNLGAGKTRFIKGISSVLGIPQKNIESPTFTIVREHKGKRLMIYHMDFYRLKTYKELEKIGYRDHYLADSSAIVLIEWIDRVRKCVKDANVMVVMSHKGENKRKIKIYRKV